MTKTMRSALAGIILLVGSGVSPFAISLADNSESRAAVSASALGTAFTYQGRLTQNGVPMSGSYDFEFRLFDAPASGNQVPNGTTVVALTRTVTYGVFTADLDFGALAFDGNARWLDIQARPAASGAFVTLSPRQPLTAAPYALFALRGGTQYTAGAGLTLTGAQFNLEFLGTGPVNGLANTAARSDHNHFGQTWTGNTVSTSGLNVYNSGTGSAIVGQGGSSSGYLGYRGSIGVIGGTGSGICGNVTVDSILAGVYGTSCHNDSSSDGVRGYSFKGSGVRGESAAIGVQGDAAPGNGTGIGVYGVAGDYPPNLPILTGVHGYSNGGVGVYGRSLGPGSVGVKGLADGTNSLAGQFVGPISASGCTGCAGPSDQRLKHNIAPSTRGLADIVSLKPVRFAYNEKIYGLGTHLGFLAQDVREVLPELVREMETGYLRVDYDGVIPVLTRAIQEQQAQIEAMKAELEPVAGRSTRDPRVDALVAEVAALRQHDNRSETPWLLLTTVAIGFMGAGLILGRGTGFPTKSAPETLATLSRTRRPTQYRAEVRPEGSQ